MHNWPVPKWTPLKEWTDKDREVVIRTISELTPEQRAQFPEDVRRGDRPFNMQERWLLDEFNDMQPGQIAMGIKSSDCAPERAVSELDRARGCLMGQLCWDSLGGLVEFQSPQEIKARYPQGVRSLSAGGMWNTLAGQPTDDSEMALALARMLAEKKIYDADAARQRYITWLDSNPFDCGQTIASGLRGRPIAESQANGAMMRVSPLGIFASRHDLSSAALWAEQDAELTHPHPICRQANALYVMAIAYAIREAPTAAELYQRVVEWAGKRDVLPELSDAIRRAAVSPPAEYLRQQGWVLIAFQNALWQLLHASNFEEALVDTVMRGGDTDTNAAICGALLGALYGVEAIPGQWSDAVLSCRPMKGAPGVAHPRPECYWPVDAPELAGRLLS